MIPRKQKARGDGRPLGVTEALIQSFDRPEPSRRAQDELYKILIPLVVSPSAGSGQTCRTFF
ncbi:protein of unknown function [Methylocaldum szegediense]|uniref:Uncharacterized protein n=1 Tax=Methylocaldum szegediense TaxID=73780 RepID=A0ABM9I9G5_9GAMM|nr:protein of unknown function [Methylocaldum szegediense]